jgi:hypothetical protein
VVACGNLFASRFVHHSDIEVDVPTIESRDSCLGYNLTANWDCDGMS